MRLGRKRLLCRAAACAVPLALAISGCGTTTTGGNSSVIVRGSTLTIDLGQPVGGARSEPARDVLAAEQLAFRESGGKAGPYTLHLRTLGARTLSDNARAAIADQSTIAYLGELVPGTSDVSVEIVNQQGLLEVSPLDTAAYLTQPVPPVSNSVQTFYPGHATYHETFARVVPSSAVEAKALVAEMQSEHVSSLYVADDGQRYGATLALEVRSAAKAAGLTVSAGPPGSTSCSTARCLGSAQGAFYAGSLASTSSRAAAAHFFDQTAASSSSIKLFAPSGLYDSAFAAALSPAAQQRLVVSSPGFTPGKLPPAGSAFSSAFASAYHHAPAPQAVFGYEAMKAVVAVLQSAGRNAASRAVVVNSFRSLKRTGTAIGDYTIKSGDPSLAPFVFAHVHSGALVPFRFASLAG
jgi:ABC-type branched-subunit amino acid transport system substrate-binding protein